MKDDVRGTARNAIEHALGRIGRPWPNGRLDERLSIVDDLGVDSLRFIDLAVALEESLNISEFPMQAWYDGEVGKDAPRFTVESLLQVCELCLSEDRGAS